MSPWTGTEVLAVQIIWCADFKETDHYEGRRLYLTKTREEKDSPLIEQIRRKKYPAVEEKYKTGPKYLIYFHLDQVLPLIGEGK
jgi:hypothetical protein